MSRELNLKLPRPSCCMCCNAASGALGGLSASEARLTKMVFFFLMCDKASPVKQMLKAPPDFASVGSPRPLAQIKTHLACKAGSLACTLAKLCQQAGSQISLDSATVCDSTQLHKRYRPDEGGPSTDQNNRSIPGGTFNARLGCERQGIHRQGRKGWVGFGFWRVDTAGGADEDDSSRHCVKRAEGVLMQFDEAAAA